ncbi:hypothetical protein C8J57DRAFT_1673254 [Mycena rebaudengoi]|nr:hypothetical protein C8J57DRAFT_1673254 [Mycena rebaudengoi]
MTHDTAKVPLMGSAPGAPFPGGPSNSAPPQPSYQTMPPPPLYVRTYTEPPRYRHSPAMRFFMAFIIAMGIWATASILFSAHIHRHVRRWGHHWDIPSEVILGRCVQDIDWIASTSATNSENIKYSATPSFDIPLTSESVVILSRRASSWFSFSFSPNTLDITTSPILQNVARVVVDRGQYPQFVKACVITRHNGETGVGVFTAGSFFGFSTGPLRVKLMLPEAANSSYTI